MSGERRNLSFLKKISIWVSGEQAEANTNLHQHGSCLDRFLAKNASKVAQIRGNEGLARKKVENLQEELKKWTTHKV